MLKDNLKKLRKEKGLSQEDLSEKLHVVRQTISKWEKGLSVPDADMLVSISEVFDTPVSKIIEDNKKEKKLSITILTIIDIILVILFIILALLKSPYLNWDYNNIEWAILGTIYHSFEWIYFKVAPILIIIITIILVKYYLKK